MVRIWVIDGYGIVNYQFSMGKSTISMGHGFNSYVKLPDGISHYPHIFQ